VVCKGQSYRLGVPLKNYFGQTLGGKFQKKHGMFFTLIKKSVSKPFNKSMFLLPLFLYLTPFTTHKTQIIYWIVNFGNPAML
jgi:hypothetical protein